ncbi:DUF190 domain-containing protein [Aeromonas dhakensis]|uniref:DUF190 domain-containing protein n=1 Tax=Aeromonas dhakensis TaxID=196024 RepID=UPI00208E2F36|nr:DUF190 domain-containing protein [Aeromonas dhakensis]USP11872.1 DUF190 domain-containing protein [Aeromonas dhakensis]
MQGYQITFFTQQDRTHGSMPFAQWLLDEAKRLGIRGATLDGAIQGFGHDSVMHAVNLFDLSDQPILITMVLTVEEVERLLSHLTKEQVKVFYVKAPVEFGTLGGA